MRSLMIDFMRPTPTHRTNATMSTTVIAKNQIISPTIPSAIQYTIDKMVKHIIHSKGEGRKEGRKKNNTTKGIFE